MAGVCSSLRKNCSEASMFDLTENSEQQASGWRVEGGAGTGLSVICAALSDGQGWGQAWIFSS